VLCGAICASSLILCNNEKHEIGKIIMQAIFWSVEEVARRAKEFYENSIRQQVEFGDNIGKMIVIDSETGEYGIDKTGTEFGQLTRNCRVGKVLNPA
ncbi:MAG: hypothetical protein SW833_26995, partial [Cyanobacteriota bacterium]|nr:hypothetical protein [Cyanobacteriota bacterium]